ncbi:oxidoreductase [Rivihabitans pingtungensis]|uniref:oxidoreductase n=1 Tax=Rivihabitans pingtungensis TaxID=1054498 RepID=UPI002357B68C|nr:oxidoreductase [Rivihabitans pingtungensis]MCK6436885.1 oxidoreductase [Rivihabitans pingtungensis]HNX69708.1 oxidoreductase [Rivihabitans pingtungensis]
MEHIKIGIIGAGETGTPLLARLFEAPFVQVVGVADLDLSQPGISLARGHGVMVTSDFMDLARLGENVDILIDVTGVPVVRESLRQYMQESGNDHTLIMHERIAILLMSLFAGRLVKGKHDELEYH